MAMSRTLIIVPRMYTKNEFREEASYVPDDYDSKSEEFWNYVAEKLSVFRGRIRKIFRESLPTNTEEDLRVLSGHEPRGHSLLVSLLREGAELEPTEDPILTSETESWMEMMRESPNEAISELYEQSLAERNRYVAKRLSESLREGEVGLLLIDSRRRLELPQDIRTIRVCPFDPADYLTSTIVKAKLNSGKPRVTS
jgi:hypothetical protein